MTFRLFHLVIIVSFLTVILNNSIYGFSDEIDDESFCNYPTSLLDQNQERISHTVRINLTETLLWNLTGHTSQVWDVSFNPGDQVLASASSDNLIKLWDVNTGQLIRNLTGHINSVYTVDFHPKEDSLASGSFDNNVLLWNVTTGQIIANLTGHTSAVWSVAFSLEGELLASGSNDNMIKLWNTSNYQLVHNLTGHTGRVRAVAFSPDGQILASASYDNSIKLWNVTTGDLLQDLINHTDNVVSIDFSADGQTLASGSSDKLINLWDVNTGELIEFINKTVSLVRTVTFNPDGQTLASGSYDNTIEIWNTIDGYLEGNLTGHAAEILGLDFDSTGQILASCSTDRSVKIWNVTDIDSDEIPDWWERLYDLNPGNMGDGSKDPDEDNLINILEFKFGTSPIEYDTDNDLIPDGFEYLNQLNGTLNDATDDLDRDGMPNLYEYENGLLIGLNDSGMDADGDGMPNIFEFKYGLLASLDDDAAEDLDNDGMPNIYEYENNLRINIDDAAEDLDKDGLTNLEEYLIGTDPRNADSDKDGWSDGVEKSLGTSPTNSLSNPLVIGVLLGSFLLIFGVITFTLIRKGPQIRATLAKMQKNFFPEPTADSWALDLQTGKAIPLNLLAKSFKKDSLEVPKIVKTELTNQQLSGKMLVMRSQMLLLEPIPPQDAICQICMTSLKELNYFQCSQCQRYVCVPDYVDLQAVGRSGCPNCSGDLVIFPFTCSACNIDFSSVKELSRQSRCPLCGYILPDQTSLRSNITNGIQPSQIINQTQDLSEEKEDKIQNHIKFPER